MNIEDSIEYSTSLRIFDKFDKHSNIQRIFDDIRTHKKAQKNEEKYECALRVFQAETRLTVYRLLPSI